MTYAPMPSKDDRRAYRRSPARPVRPGEAVLGGLLALIALVLVLL
ncbi:MAG: hypothetical protein ABJG86_07420 [Nitratireductor sp.]|nr:hypothetical protein [Nitratireductor arenosus]